MEVDQVVKLSKKAFHNKAQTNLQNKKASKPLMEKKRRERINYSLAELKIILNNTITSHEKVKNKKSKIEKADILEMAVRQFRVIRTFEQSDLNKYAAGFVDCAAEIIRFLNSPEILSLCSSDMLGSNLKSLLIQHLELCSHEMTEELSEQSPTIVVKEPNNNISPKTESSPGVHNDAEIAPPTLQEITSPIPKKHNAYLHYEDLFRHSSGHISPPDSGDESIRAAQRIITTPNTVNMSDTLKDSKKSDGIVTPSNYLDYITSFPASIWPYLLTNQYCAAMKSDFFDGDNIDVKDNNISTLEEYIGAAVEEAIQVKPILQSNIPKNDVCRNQVHRPTNSSSHEEKSPLNYAEKDLEEDDNMPIDYSLKSMDFSNDEPAVLEFLEPLSPMWRPW